MKNQLGYQITEYDCGPATIINAFRYLFEREELAPDLIRTIYLYCNDAYNDQGEYGKRGTTKAATCFLACWLEGYAQRCNLPLETQIAVETEAAIEPGSATWEWVQQGGVAMICCILDKCAHYVLMTGLTEDGHACIFDPYYETEETIIPVEGVRAVHDQPLKMNRLVPVERMNSYERVDYGMGRVEHRRNLLLRRTDGK